MDDLKLKPQTRQVDAASIEIREEDEGEMMEEVTIKAPQLTREMNVSEFAARAEKSGPYRIAFSASSSYPVSRFFGDEVLDHSGIRLDRVKRGAVPLLFNHDFYQPRGMVDTARVEGDRLLVEAHLFDTPEANELRAMIDGGLRNVSLGYRLHRVEEREDGAVMVRDFEPYEISIVTVPADPTVGIGRSAEEFEVRMIRATTTTESTEVSIKSAQAVGGNTMSDKDTAAAGASADQKVSAVQAEKERREAIANICKSNKIDSRVEARWVEEGTPLTQVAKEVLDVMEERGKARPAVVSELGLSKKESQRYSLFKAIRALHYGSKDQSAVAAAAFEIECSKALSDKLNRGGGNTLLVPAEVLTRSMSQEVMQRAMATTPGAKGGYLVNVENMGFIDILRNRSVVRNLGARVLSGLEGNVVFPRQTGAATLTWQAGEHTSVTATDQALGQLSLTPKTAIAITDVSEQLLRQSSPSAEQFVMSDLASVVAIGVDLAALKGTGGAQPIGIYNTTGVDTGQDAATATYAKILAFPESAGSVNAIRGNPGWATTISGASILMQRARFSNTDTPLWEGNLLDGTCVGFRAMSTQQLASGELIFGSWDELVIGEWGVLELATDIGGTRFNTATVGIRAMWMVDVMLRYPQAFVVSTNLS
jgi:HK97 family phage major capsid protein/HK97 family phage prohead protease